MPRISIKPISVNECWRGGRRFKTAKYEAFKQEMMYLLPKIKIPSNRLKLTIKWGLSNKNSDIDNPIKPFLDTIQEKYGFNDKIVFKLEVEKILVKKGKEFIDFKLEKC